MGMHTGERSPIRALQEALWLRFDADPTVHRSTNPLFAAEITLGSLHGNVPEKELNLLQLSTG